jgi:hypothetical protein
MYTHCMYLYRCASGYTDEGIGDAGPPHARARELRPCSRACVRVRLGAHLRRHMRAPSVGVDRGWFGSQAFSSASAFNANIGVWNVLRVSYLSDFASAFDGTGLSCAAKSRMHSLWGSTFQAAYPTFAGSCTESPASPPTPSPTAYLAATAFSPPNAPVSDGAALTILGMGFGTADTTPSGYAGGQPCATTCWTSTTALTCAAPAPSLASGAAETCPAPDPAFRTNERPPLLAGVGREAWVKVGADTTSQVFTFDGALASPALRCKRPAVTLGFGSAGRERGFGQRRALRQWNRHDQRA